MHAQRYKFDPIPGEGQSHKPFEIEILAIFKSISSSIYHADWQMIIDP